MSQFFYTLSIITAAVCGRMLWLRQNPKREYNKLQYIVLISCAGCPQKVPLLYRLLEQAQVRAIRESFFSEDAYREANCEFVLCEQNTRVV